MIAYHPDAVTSEQVAADVLAAEVLDLAAGYPPRRWTCECGALSCGYVGDGGVMWDEMEVAP